ncbi:arginase family protein [Pseudoalteromonas sp. DL2-H2.2]|uniref:arginase family protein n=1 Tax=Pseudoalteromonas sp. DL2-H2.2 TaxID=2908889 RepID=UPI001F2DD751|nr:arginase family protein [Pseudoalteromonas sp. DL2-H2.2]MCF2910584.1 arginase family protein [Pseudoalteromonas sp. DL2-H2.2]
MTDLISSEQARECYNVRHWSQGFFGINDQGEVTAMPTVDNPGHAVTLTHIAAQIKAQGYGLPALVRFPQILEQRVNDICQAFNTAIADYQYPKDYLLVYPIKVNQQREVVEGLIASQDGKEKKQLGLEAGSKAELLTVLALSEKTSAVIVCNGYKDREYIRLALICPDHSIQLGIRTEFEQSNHGFAVVDAMQANDMDAQAIAEQIKARVGDLPVYLTFDIDCLDPAFAPGTGTPVCGGLSSDKVLKILRALQGINIVGMDVVEVSPSYDQSELTSIAAATIAYELLHLWAIRHK